MTTPLANGWRKDKLQVGDLLGALTGTVGLPAAAIGKIDSSSSRTDGAIRSARAEAALSGLRGGKLKGRSFRTRRLG